MKKIFNFLLLASLLFSLSAIAQEVKFIHITDIELSETNAYKVQETIKELNSFEDVDFIVFGGNNLSKQNFELLKTFVHLLKKVDKKHYVLMGPKDVLASKGINKEFYLKKIAKTKYIHSKRPNYTFENKGYLFVVMDGVKQYFQSSNGYYTKEELMWLEKTLEENKDKKIIILQHFPLLSADSKWIETAKMEEYKELLAKYENVKVIVSGHYGKNQELKQDGIYHIVTESYSKSGAYKIIEIDLDYDFIGTYLIKD